MAETSLPPGPVDRTPFVKVLPLVVIEEARDGLDNMAEDRRWLESAEAAEEPLVRVRLYRWEPPTASVGMNQDPASALDVDACRSEAVPIVRRPTGGRAVFHDRTELTYSVICNSPSLTGTGGILETYRRIAEVLRAGLRGVGVDTKLERSGTGERAGAEGTHRTPCFASASRHELLWQGRKIAGSAQRRLRRAVLQHGSIPLEIDYPRMARLLGAREPVLRRSMVSVSEAAGRRVGADELAESMKWAFATLLISGT